MSQTITIGKPCTLWEHNTIQLLVWDGLATWDIILWLNQILSFDTFKSKTCNSRLSGHFAPDSNTALPALYKLFNGKWEEEYIWVPVGLKWKIELDMNNYQRYEAKKDYHVSLERTDYGIFLEAFYNKLNSDVAFGERNNTIDREDNMNMSIVEESKQWLYNNLQFEPHTMLYVSKNEFKMLEYLIANLSVK